MTDYEKLTARWVEIREQLEQLKLEEDQIKTQLAHLDVGTHEIGAWKVQVQAPRRTLNKTRVAAAFPAEQYPSMYSMQLDPKAVKQQVAPTVLEQYMETATSPVIVLK